MASGAAARAGRRLIRRRTALYLPWYVPGAPGYVDLTAVNAYDPTIISHVEPLDFGNFARPGYYWNHESAQFNALWAQISATADTAQRLKLLAQAQRLVADDAVAAYLDQPTAITIAHTRLKEFWKDMPISANDLSALSWS